ncbi:hypothetical protein [Acidovorax sp. NCPPB 3576]|uniref:hypothetical protein n=1 Tax=Acidovorax sp. NCPPB 3576 TaxID=2940488 RepID=UPI00234BA0F4|nr:hypothetical protein [Acidovorax sp. NCPPB 3576]WCM91005.1 hypothetical protein M5C98_03925 [Acidovorax sp. NCPPB 3576]
MPLPDDAHLDDAAAADAVGGARGQAGRDAGAKPGADCAGWQVVHLHPSAPPQPAQGAPCNGCGLCCLAEPCPLGMLVSRRRRGPCAALRWREAGAESAGDGDTKGGSAARHHADDGRENSPGAAAAASPGRYVCGMVADPGEVTGWRSAWAVGLMRALARRWIAAGIGCDAPPLRWPETAGHAKPDEGNSL